MFRILESQMQHLAAKTKREFVAMMATYLSKHFQSSVGKWSPEELHTWLTQALDKAEHYHVTTEPEAAQLILFFLVLGLDADERLPWVRDTLTDRDLVALGKVRKLAELSRAQQVQGIEQAIVYDELEG